MNEIRTSIHDLDEEVSDTDEKFIKEIEILKKEKIPNGNVGSEKFIKANKNTVENTTNRINQEEKRISGIKDKVEEVLHLGNNREKSMTTALRRSCDTK
jgi:hypothetical protein